MAECQFEIHVCPDQASDPLQPAIHSQSFSIFVHSQSSTDLEQTRVSVKEMWPGEQHRSSALTRAHIEHSLGSAANIARGTEA